jgi:hypothetical protein
MINKKATEWEPYLLNIPRILMRWICEMYFEGNCLQLTLRVTCGTGRIYRRKKGYFVVWEHVYKIMSPDVEFAAGVALVFLYDNYTGACSSVVGWGAMLQAGRSWFRFPMKLLSFYNWPDPSSRTMALGSNQPLTEMSTRNISECEERPTRKADNFIAICEPMWEPRRLTNLWASTACYRDWFTLIRTKHKPEQLSR